MKELHCIYMLQFTCFFVFFALFIIVEIESYAVYRRGENNVTPMWDRSLRSCAPGGDVIRLDLINQRRLNVRDRLGHG